MYLTYNEYKAYGGSLSESNFGRFSFRAETEIDNNTQGRLKKIADIPECVKRCEYELILYLSKNATNGAVSVVSGFSNDGYSVQYSEPKEAKAEIYGIIYTYLADTGLMYCGTDGVNGYSFTEPVKDGYSYLLVKDN